MSGFHGINTAMTGLRAARSRIDVASDNIAGAGNDGHTRRQVRVDALGGAGGAPGGVQVSDIARQRDAFLDLRVRNTSADAAGTAAYADALLRLERAVAEPDAGVAAALDQLWNAFDDLGNNPQEGAAREQALQALDGLARTLNRVDGALSQVATDLQARLADRVAETNRTAADIARLNATVRSTPDGDTDPALADQRDLLADRFVELTGGTVGTDPDGTLRLAVGGRSVVDGTATFPLAADAGQLTAAGGQVPAGGELGGILNSFGGNDRFGVADARARYDEIAAALTDELNSQHAAGFLAGTATAGGDLLDGTTAAGIGLAAGLTAADLATAGTANAGPQDGSNAHDLAGLRLEEAGQAAGTLAGLPVGDLPRAAASEFAATVAAARADESAQASIAAAAASARRGEYGVSIDEELVDLLSQQRAFEASARVVNVIDGLLDTLINRTGNAGR